MKHVNSKELWIHYQTLSASETADLVTSMRDRVKRQVLNEFSNIRYLSNRYFIVLESFSM